VSKQMIIVRTERLDRSLPAGYVPAVIIIDVEGAEQQVVEGALETIRRHQPIVVFEHGLGAADHYGTARSTWPSSSGAMTLPSSGTGSRGPEKL
jgi:hypothetical protein